MKPARIITCPYCKRMYTQDDRIKGLLLSEGPKNIHQICEALNLTRGSLYPKLKRMEKEEKIHFEKKRNLVGCPRLVILDEKLKCQ